MANLPEDLLDRIKQLERRLQRTATAATSRPTPPWLPLPLASGVTTATNAPQYRVQGSLLVIQGDVAAGGGVAEGTVLANLPATSAPTKQQILPVATPNTTAARIDVNTDGSVRYHGATASWVGVNVVVSLG